MSKSMKGHMKKKKVSEAPYKGTTITNCQFTASAANWDPKQVEAVTTVAKALLNLTEFFKNQGITAPLIQIGHEGPCKP